MSRETIIEKTIQAINQLPEEKAEEISDFAAWLLKKYEDHLLQKGIQNMVSNSETFNFLKEDEVTYDANDLKEKYH